MSKTLTSVKSAQFLYQNISIFAYSVCLYFQFDKWTNRNVGQFWSTHAHFQGQCGLCIWRLLVSICISAEKTVYRIVLPTRNGDPNKIRTREMAISFVFWLVSRLISDILEWPFPFGVQSWFLCFWNQGSVENGGSLQANWKSNILYLCPPPNGYSGGQSKFEFSN